MRKSCRKTNRVEERRWGELTIADDPWTTYKARPGRERTSVAGSEKPHAEMSWQVLSSLTFHLNTLRTGIVERHATKLTAQSECNKLNEEAVTELLGRSQYSRALGKQDHVCLPRCLISTGMIRRYETRVRVIQFTTQCISRPDHFEKNNT